MKNGIFNLAEKVRQTSIKFPNRIAVIEPDGYSWNGKRKYKKYTYAQLSSDVESVAPGLREIGIHEGVRTVSMMPPSYEACVLGLALQRVGAFTLLIDPAVGYLNVSERLNRIKPEAFVGVPLALLGRTAFGWGPRFSSKSIVIDGYFPGAHTLASLKRKAPAQPKDPNVSLEDPATVLYTTGSTGPAKPTLYLHKNYSKLFEVVHQSWRFDPENKVHVDMPVFPAFFFIALSAGGTMVVPPINYPRDTPETTNSKALLEVINDCHVESCFASPVILQKMARYAVQHNIQTPNFRRVIGGGAPITESVKKDLLKMMGDNAQVFSNYGATEALPSTEMSAQEAISETFPLTNQGMGICVGRPFDGVEIRIIKIVDDTISSIEQTENIPLGQLGEIIVRGEHISPRYYLDEESTKKNKVPDPTGQWHRLGDTGYIDEKGRLWVCGRVSQRVKTTKGDVLTLQAEFIINTHPLVMRSGLASVPLQGDNIPVICIQLNETFKGDKEDLRKELLNMASQNIHTNLIKHLLFIEKLPVDPRHNSKIERPKLSKWAEKQLQSDADFSKAAGV
ncbi:MAG: AMP-binding protein [Chitinophagales bacterium]|nr:fatty acid CoA ligase family protein [Chitinophagales bacterium]MCZ2394151.1 AMP-binding protein [Chitinophagales bacterium]